MFWDTVHPLQVLDKLEGGQDVHGADIALKRHEAIRTDVEARVSGWGGGEEGRGGIRKARQIDGMGDCGNIVFTIIKH